MRTNLVHFVAAVLLQVATDVTEERDIADTGGDESQQGTDKDENGETDGDEEATRDVVFGVFGNVVPITWLRLLGDVEGVEGEGVDGLTGTIGK